MSNINLGLGHIGIIVKDLEVSKKFYCDNLNFTVIHENTLGDNDSVTKIAFVEAGDRWILFRGPDGERLEINEIL